MGLGCGAGGQDPDGAHGVGAGCLVRCGDDPCADQPQLGGVGGRVGTQVQLPGLWVECDRLDVLGQVRRDSGCDVRPPVQHGSAGGRELPGPVGHQALEHGGEPAGLASVAP